MVLKQRKSIKSTKSIQIVNGAIIVQSIVARIVYDIPDILLDIEVKMKQFYHLFLALYGSDRCNWIFSLHISESFVLLRSCARLSHPYL